MFGPTLLNWVNATPATPAIPAPRPKVMASIDPERAPSALAISRFCETALSFRPKNVYLSTHISTRNINRQKIKITTRLIASDNAGSNCHKPVNQEGLLTGTFCGEIKVRTVCCRIRLMPKVASSVSSGRPYRCRMTRNSINTPAQKATANAAGSANNNEYSEKPGSRTCIAQVV